MGVLKRPDGGVSTELSVTVPIGGKETLVPLLVPTLHPAEINALLAVPEDTKPWDALKNYDAIEQKAVEHAKQRMSQGLSPFAQENERNFMKRK